MCRTPISCLTCLFVVSATIAIVIGIALVIVFAVVVILSLLLLLLFTEPGYYRENEFGVRLENVLEVIEKPWLHVSGQPMYGFKDITLVPYEPKLIKFSLLSHYHVS